MCDTDSPRDTRQWLLIIISLCSLSSLLSLCLPYFLNTWQQATGKIGQLKDQKLNLEDSMVCVEDPKKIVLEKRKKQLHDLEEETSKLADSHRGSRHQWRAHERQQNNAQAFVSNKAWAKNRSNDTEGKNLPNDWSERDAPLHSFGVKQDSLEEYDGVVNTKWWSVGMIEEHGWRNGHEKKPNENYGRDKTVVW